MKTRYIRKNEITIYFFLIVPVAWYAVFFIFPNLNSLFSSFYEWDGLAPVKVFVGLDNYVKMLGSPIFQKAFFNTLKYTVTLVVFQTFFGLLLAVLVFRASKVHNFFRTLYFMPAMLSMVTIGIVFSFILDPNIGALNVFLRAIGLDSLTEPWLSHETLAIYVVAFVHVWAGTGYSVVLFVAGMQNIPLELYESADIDGASPWRQFWRVTLPMLRTTMLIVLVLTTIGGFKAFEIVYVMTRGGNDRSSEVLATLLYKQAYAFSNFGVSAAISVILLAIVLTVTAVQMRVLRRVD